MVQMETLPNGVRIVTERMDTVRSAARGIWVGGGSREERPEESGAAHFIEHMLFKGTEHRSAADIARQTDAIGGQMNAFTTKECTCFYGRVLDSHLLQALDILWDMVYHSSFTQEAVETERGVILEEIDMYEDTPDDLCAEKLFGQVFQGSSLARPILGSPETLKTMTGNSLRAYHQRHYRADNTVVALAGSIPPQVLEEIRRRFATLPGGEAEPQPPAVYTPSFVVTEKPIEQNHLTLAFPGLTYHSPKRFALQLLSSILGGGVSSRLFQQVREQQGLCYTVYSYGAGHEDTGVFCIYTALNRETEEKALTTIRQVVETFLKEGPTPEELERAREQSKANVVMGLESTQARMSHAGRSLLFTGEILSPEQIIAAYDGVTRQDVMELAQQLLRWDQVSLSAVGQVRTVEEYKALLFS
ncbi:MAG: pitrilysin family protein [Evtepia sp.]|uniref:M16 family metallopeptidase n=1 Tax=Evtepia sp. TaxID=2773933 RepID=UPI002A75A525|nr:pitrilysin family protein [Evtepia sp.]MDY3014285.1 pitrilysin family protein [Evtepia sp.]